MIRIIVILCAVLIASPLPASERCSAFMKDVRIEHVRHFGFAFPYWYSTGQLEAESACRTTPTAFDGGQGVAQFMPKTAQYIQSLIGEQLDPYNPKHAIRMQAFYMYRIHTKENWTDRLWIDFQVYNGGASTLKAEYKRAGVLDWDVMKAFCQRKKIQMKWGVLDLCTVNYDYSKKVEKYGNGYRRGPDGMRYW